jgi:hypothetical protein
VSAVMSSPHMRAVDVAGRLGVSESQVDRKKAKVTCKRVKGLTLSDGERT